MNGDEQYSRMSHSSPFIQSDKKIEIFSTLATEGNKNLQSGAKVMQLKFVILLQDFRRGQVNFVHT